MCIVNAVEYKWFHLHPLVISKLQLTLASAVASAVVPAHGWAREHAQIDQCKSMNTHNNVNEYPHLQGPSVFQCYAHKNKRA